MIDIIDSPCKIYLYDLLRDVVEHHLAALAHPVAQLGEVYLVGCFLLLGEVLLEDYGQALVVREDVVEGVADD